MGEVFVLLPVRDPARIVQQLQDKLRQQQLKKKEKKSLSIYEDAGGVSDIKLSDAVKQVQKVCGRSNERRES